MSMWNISIFMPAHLLRAQTRENLNLPSLKHSWFLWRRSCALHCEGKSVRVCQKTPNSFSPPTSKSSYIAAEVQTQCLQSERARRVKHPLQKNKIKKVKQQCNQCCHPPPPSCNCDPCWQNECECAQSNFGPRSALGANENYNSRLSKIRKSCDW